MPVAFVQNWNDIKVFLAIARHGSLAGAARALRVNHSTVFRRLNALESAAGVRLFDRQARGYLLTTAGEDMLESAGRMGELVDDLDRRLAGRDYRLSGTLCVTTTDTLAGSFLNPHLKAFRTRYPGIVLQVVTADAFFDLARREADVALRPGNDPPAYLLGRNLATVGWALYGAADYLSGRRAPRRLSDLARHALISGDDSLAAVPAVRWLRRRAPASAIVYRANSFGVQFAAARAGCGLALLPCVVADSAPELVRVIGPIKALASGLWLLAHPHLRNTARVRVFMSFISDAIRAERTRLAGS